MRSLTTVVVKVLISALLLYLSLRRVNLGSVGQRLSGVDLRWMTLILAITCSQVLLLALRWREIVVVSGMKLSLPLALNYSFIGQFFSQVLPSTVGGDAARAWLLTRGGGAWSSAIYSVLIDRIIGVSILAVLVTACLPWTLNMIRDPLARTALVLIGLGALAGLLVFLILGMKHLRVMQRWFFTRHLAVASRVAWQLCRSVAGVRFSGDGVRRQFHRCFISSFAGDANCHNTNFDCWMGPARKRDGSCFFFCRTSRE